MQYLLLIYESESNRGNVDRAKLMEEYGTFTKSIIETGNFKAGDGLQPTSTATTVRLKDGKPVTTHGPRNPGLSQIPVWLATGPRPLLRHARRSPGPGF